MSLQLQLHSLKCRNETAEASASDEAYVLVTVATLRPPLPGVPVPPLPNFRVFKYGVFEDMDDDDAGPVVIDGLPFWGLDGGPADIQDPADVAIVVSLMEQDNGTPEQYVELLNVKTALSLAASAGDPDPRSRAARLTADINNVLNAVDVPIPFNFDDDHLGTQQLVLDRSDLLTSGFKDRSMVIAGDGGEYELIIRARFRGWHHGVPGGQAPAVAPGTRPTAWYSFPENVQHIAYAGTDGLIHELFFFIGGDGTWHHGTPGAGHPPIKPGTSPAGWYTHPENVQHIAYVGTDDVIHELFFFIGGDGTWHHGTPGAGHPPVKPGTSPAGWYSFPENVQHIGYVGNDDIVHELFFFIGGDGTWHHGTPGAGHPPVQPGTSPTGWYTHPENVQHIAYAGTDGQIHELFFFIGGDGTWHHGVPGSQAPPIAPGTSPAGWYSFPENVQHIGYVGTDGLVHELFFFIGGDGTWLHGVPGEGHPPARAGTSPAGWYTHPENVQHVAYVGPDDLVHELFFFIQ